jgi:hypothetical protein
MTAVQDFIHRHYSPAVGESPAGHAIAIVAGLLLTAIGAALVVSIVFLAAGVAIGVLGLLILGAGIFGHIMSPLTLSDLMDTVIGLSGVAISVTIVLVAAGLAAGIGISVVVSLFRWLTA